MEDAMENRDRDKMSDIDRSEKGSEPSRRKGSDEGSSEWQGSSGGGSSSESSEWQESSGKGSSSGYGSSGGRNSGSESEQ